MKPQEYLFKCPHCGIETSEVQVAASLHDDVLVAEGARRNARRQTPHAGPGRPTTVRCPGCDDEMSTIKLRGHRLSCVADRLEKLQATDSRVRLSPKDPDPHPDFAIRRVSGEVVTFEKLSSGQHLEVEIRKVAEINLIPTQKIIHLRVLGRVCWNNVTKHWSYEPSRLGRPPRVELINRAYKSLLILPAAS